MKLDTDMDSDPYLHYGIRGRKLPKDLKDGGETCDHCGGRIVFKKTKEGGVAYQDGAMYTNWGGPTRHKYHGECASIVARQRQNENPMMCSYYCPYCAKEFPRDDPLKLQHHMAEHPAPNGLPKRPEQDWHIYNFCPFCRTVITSSRMRYHVMMAHKDEYRVFEETYHRSGIEYHLGYLCNLIDGRVPPIVWRDGKPVEEVEKPLIGYHVEEKHMAKPLEPEPRESAPGQQLIVKVAGKANLCRYCGGEMTDDDDIEAGYHDGCYTRKVVRTHKYQTSVNRPLQKTFKDYFSKNKNLRAHAHA